ncbi:hypothetical protein [Rathayibacter soli]|uniref:hypothetical protein n=1 Tax=Rathayibacter soli TaxID=3144168 RepID=UPI0027E44F87|nr:hypothetical protein [Glaciibacter superstes]
MIVFAFPFGESAAESWLRTLPVSLFWAGWVFVYIPAGFVAGILVGFATYVFNRLFGSRWTRNNVLTRIISATFGTGCFVAVMLWWWTFGFVFDPARMLLTVVDFGIVIVGSVALFYFLPPGRTLRSRTAESARVSDLMARVDGATARGDSAADQDGVDWLGGLVAQKAAPLSANPARPQSAAGTLQSGVVGGVGVTPNGKRPSAYRHRWWRVGGVSGTIVLVSVLLGAVQGAVIGVVQGLMLGFPSGSSGNGPLVLILVLLGVAGVGIGAVGGGIVGVSAMLLRMGGMAVFPRLRAAEWVGAAVGGSVAAVICVGVVSDLIVGSPWLIGGIVATIDVVVLLWEMHVWRHLPARRGSLAQGKAA